MNPVNVDPSNPIYQAAARALLEKMQEINKSEREAAGEFPETWPSEQRIFPATPYMVEGVLYMPKASPSVVLMQAHAHPVKADGVDIADVELDDLDEESDVPVKLELETIVLVFPPATTTVLELARDYQDRADLHYTTCTCGHMIPAFIAMSEDEEEAVDDAAANYECPACGYRPNRHYGE